MVLMPRPVVVLQRMSCVCRVMVAGQIFDADSDCDSQQQCKRQLASVMVVKGYFRKEVGKRNAQKETTRDGQAPSQEGITT